MSTMDLIKYHGGEPANFLDVGGGAQKDQVLEAFRILLADPNVKAVLVNIFGGIMKCDTIASALLAAYDEIDFKVPLVVRLEGTNVDLGKKLLDESGRKIITAVGLTDAAKKVVAAAKGGGLSADLGIRPDEEIATMTPTTQAPATLDDLYKVEGKAELIDGRIVHFMASGFDPARVAFEIAVSLRFTQAGGVRGRLRRRDRLCPRSPARRTVVSRSRRMPRITRDRSRRIGCGSSKGTPTFAVEVRSENDYGPAAEAEMEAKRADYFEAGTPGRLGRRPDGEDRSPSIRGDPAIPVAVYGPGQVAEARAGRPGLAAGGG